MKVTWKEHVQQKNNNQQSSVDQKNCAYCKGQASKSALIASVEVKLPAANILVTYFRLYSNKFSLHNSFFD